jgi:hypothetical protein
VTHDLIEPLLHYNVDCLDLEANVLRDSVLQRLELFHFQAHTHTCAIMWECAFKELRALTNSSDVDLNPLELHDVHDCLWTVGVKLQGDSPLTVLDERPWPKVRPDDPAAQRMHAKLETGAAEKKATLRLDRRGENKKEHNVVLTDVLRLFGEGIHEPLTRTMGHCLKNTNGKWQNSS